MKISRALLPTLTAASAAALVFAVLTQTPPALAYPPAVGVLSKAKNCLACHVNNGPWKDDEKTIIDLRDKDTNRSLRQADGSFLIELHRGETKTVLTVIGRSREDTEVSPYRNGWIYIDPRTIDSASLSKFAPGWEVNLPMSCRLVGDTLEGLAAAKISVLPMTLRAADPAQNADLLLQVMLTRGESVKGMPRQGMIGSYFERTVRLRVKD